MSWLCLSERTLFFAIELTFFSQYQFKYVYEIDNAISVCCVGKKKSLMKKKKQNKTK